MSKLGGSNNERKFTLWFFDMLVLAGLFVLSYSLFHGFSAFALSVPLYREMFLYILLFHTIVVFIPKSYDSFLRRGYLKELMAVVRHIVTIYVFLLIFLFIVQHTGEASRLTLIIFFVLAIVFVYLERILIKHIICKRSSLGYNKYSALVVTVPKYAEQFSEVIHSTRDYNICGIACFENYAAVDGKLCGIPVVANDVKSALSYIKNHWVDEVFVVLPDSSLIPEDFYTACCKMGVTVSIAMQGIADYGYNSRKVHSVSGVTFISNSISSPDPAKLMLKRLLDIVGGVVGLILTAIFFIIFAPIIKIQSPGPVFFSQTRIGINGKRFKIYKFRTMYKDAEQRKAELMKQNKMNGLMFKVDDDPRITPVGKFLRKTSIDEFPQFLNVLLGQMSLVGTRPPTEDEYEQYSYHHKVRLAMKPGITGMWQATGRSDITDFEEVVRLDKEYIENWSLSLDIKILFKTVFAVLKQKGSE